MDVLVNVVNQKIKVTTNLKNLVAGTQEFVKFNFSLSDDWDNLLVFAQFIQNGNAYNQYLDENKCAYLPSEIGAGTCTMMLYGSGDNVIATTNYITFSIDRNILVNDAQSTDISTSLYNQLVTRVNTLITFNSQYAAEFAAADRELQQQINTKASQSDLDAEIARASAAETANANAIALKANQSQVDAMALQLDQLVNNEVVADAISEAVAEELEEYLNSGRLAGLAIGDGSIARSKVNTAFEATLLKADNAMQPSVYDRQNLRVDIYSYAQGRADAVQTNLDAVTEELQDGYMLTDTLRYTKIGDAIRGAVSLSRDYMQALLVDYKAFTIRIVDELPVTGNSMTFYLVPKSGGTGYDKYWWITDDGVSKWDIFGSSTTLVVTELPLVGDEDTDYILKSSSGCLYYKYINGVWEVVAGSIASVLSELPQTGNEFTDYYILNSSGVYVHYRYINGEFHSIGSETYTSGEIDILLSAIQDDVDRNASDIEANATNIASLSRTIDRVSQELSNLDVEGATYYATLTTEDNSTYVYTLYEVEDNVETVKSQFVLPSGGGGGGSSITTNLVVDRITASPIICTPTDSVIIEIDYSSTDSDNELVDGTYVIKRGSSTVMSGNLVQGRNSFDLTEYCSIGSQKFTLTVTDEGGSVNVKSWTVQVADVRLESAFNDRYTYPAGSSVNFTYTPYGAISKVIHFKLDGVTLESVSTSASGTLQSYSLPAQTHGAHLLECWMTAVVNSTEIETEHIFKDIIWYDASSDIPVIGCIYRYDHYGTYTAKQYNTTTIPYVVYDPRTTTPNVSLSIDDVVVSSLKLTVNSNTWAYKSEDIAVHVLKITCGETDVTIRMNIVELGYDISPITANLEFDFNPVGLSNSSVNRLWQDENHPNVQLSVSENFDWNNGGYQLDENNNSYFCVKAGTRAYISYNLFENNPKQTGAEFKFIFKTSNVRDISTTFLSCIPTEDATIVGLKMNAHEAYLYSSTDSLYIPYSEEDIIEFEYNINTLDLEDENATSYIMSYEDGVGLRPLLYDDSHRLYQYNPVPITIGSDDCDVYIYRMKAYSSSLTDSDILSNFIADSLDSDTMIARYERNQIYDENNNLTPDSVANACPDLKIIKIECPHFTNDKNDYVKNTNVECIHKNGDPVLDNWKFVNGYHAGQGTTSNEYGYAGRNIDIIFGFDGEHQVVSKIPLDTSYITELTLGDGTKYLDGSGKVALTRTSVPNNWFNIKVNIASSENANNALLQKRYNDYLPYKTPAMKRNPFIKNSMEFCNCVIFIRESDPDTSTHREFDDTGWHFYGIGNLGDSKKTDNTRVNDPTDLKEFVVEVSDNTLPNSWFQTGVYKDANDNITYDPNEGVEMVYPITSEQWNNANNLKRISLYDEWDESFEFRYDMGTKDGETISSAEIEAQQEASKQVWRDMYEFVVTSTDAEFVSNLGNWFITESPLYWYLFTERYTMIDNRAKNSFWHWGKTYISETEAVEMGDDAQYYTIDNDEAAINEGYRFDLWDYDNDTSLGINNTGELKMTYGKEDIDYKTDGVASSGYIFNAAENVFFRRIRNLMYSQLQSMYLSRESLNCWSAESLITEFDNWQNQFPEELWRLDIERKYLRTYRGGTIRFLNAMMNGRKRYQRRQFERDQEAYIGTKYVGTKVRADQIMFRCNTPQTDVVVEPDYTLRIVPYSDMYLTVLYGNSPSPVQIRAKAGQEYEITTALTEMDDTAILIYCASRIQELNDLSACYIHDNDFSKASKLKTLIIGNETEGYENMFLESLNMGNNTLLETLDIRNCPNLVGSINLSACFNLENLYADGTSISSATFATNGKIAKVHFPATINTLVFRNINNLSELLIAGYRNIETFICEYSNIDALTILRTAINTLQTVRILGIDWELADTSILNSCIQMNSSLLSGEVYISGAIRNQELLNYETAWSDLEVSYDPQNLVTQYLATYVNTDGTELYRYYVDRGELPIDPVNLGLISAPTQESTAQYDFTFDGWDDVLSEMLSPRTITATYSNTIRTYRVTWYSRIGLSLGSTTVQYGQEAVYQGEIPTNTSEEASFTYNVFKGWDKSTGFVKSDLDVYAVWDRALLPALGTDLKNMSVAQIYGIASSGRATNYFEDKDYIDIPVGRDYSFSNVQSEVLAQNKYFDGETVQETNIYLFDENAESFTLAVDFEFTDTEVDNTLISCFEESGSEGFRLRYSSAPNVHWGNTNVQVGLQYQRGMVVLRHVKGSNTLFVYASDVSTSANVFPDACTRAELVRNRATATDINLVLGACKFANGGYDFYGKGWIHWCKIWHDDLGDTVCRELACWIHETWRAEYCGTSRYRLAGNTSLRTNASFILNNMLNLGHCMNPTNTNDGGWYACAMRTFINDRVYKALPVEWRSILKKCKINSTEGNQSSAIVTSEDNIYLVSYAELNGSTSSPFINEGTSISFFVNGAARLKFRGQIIRENAVFMTEGSDPTLLSGYHVQEGDIWINSNNSSIGYMYLSATTVAKHKHIGILLSASDNVAASDGGLWLRAQSWWERSPGVSNSTAFYGVNYGGGAGSNGGASGTNGVVPCFSI